MRNYPHVYQRWQRYSVWRVTLLFTHVMVFSFALQWRHNDCLLNRLFWRRSKKASKLRVTGLCEGISPLTGELSAQRASNAENSSISLRWRHNGRDSVSIHQPHDCLRNRLFRRRSKKTSKLRVTGLCVGNSPGTGEFPARLASNAENVSMWWRHHVYDFSMVNDMGFMIITLYIIDPPLCWNSFMVGLYNGINFAVKVGFVHYDVKDREMFLCHLVSIVIMSLNI